MKGLLNEFAKWLKKRGYDQSSIRALLFKEWDGAYPQELLGDDIIRDIENFLYDMAQFAVERVFGSSSTLFFSIVPLGDYETASEVFVLEMKTKTVLANLVEKTWRFNPDVIEECIEDLIEQLEESKKLLSVRTLTDS